jgi:hypothetical protein
VNKPGKHGGTSLIPPPVSEVHPMRLYLFYENVPQPVAIEIPDSEVDGFMREYEEALHDTSVETFEWRNSCFRIAGLMAIVQHNHLSS